MTMAKQIKDRIGTQQMAVGPAAGRVNLPASGTKIETNKGGCC